MSSNDTSFYNARVYEEQMNTEYIRQQAAELEKDYWRLKIEKEGLKPNNEPALLDALREVRELIDGYSDVTDGPEGVPAPNNAMRAVQIIDDAIAKIERKP